MKKEKSENSKNDSNLAPAHDAHTYTQSNARSTDILEPTKEQVDRINTYSINGIELKKILKAHGTTQKQFADALEMTKASVCTWCTSTRKIRYVYVLKLVELTGEDFFITTVAKIRGK